MAPFADEPYAVILLSAGMADARWSYIARSPVGVTKVAADAPGGDFAPIGAMLGARSAAAPGGPPFQGGVIGLIAYEFGDRLEALGLGRDPDWPDLVLARFDALLAFDHRERVVWAVGRGDGERVARTAARRAADWLGRSPASGDDFAAASFAPETCDEAYEGAVANTAGRIFAGEIFQANIARTWRGRLAPSDAPFDVFRRLMVDSPAPYGAYWRLPGLALVSHSPERFLAIAADGRTVETRPIKGTRPRSADPAEDARMAAELLASAKDRAENLMIVDLMRNDLSRVCQPGSVKTPSLMALESYASVHHLVSTVTGRLRPGLDAADLLAATFPPGSITGAPKVQAMKVIAAHEPPRGPWCGSLFWAGYDGAFDSSVLIRTAAFVEDAGGWRFRASAGAGIVADSDPLAERLETEVKISGLARALRGET